ncbi:MAG: MazG-like family protein [Oscillospiraceae bacterium]|nr:MazG-like family protein [Oscillospiraceae bacterium]
MNNFVIDEMLEMQRELQEQYKDIWESISPETGKNKLLWMIGEIGEVIDIIKKNGDKAADDPETRPHLTEELADVLMYYNDVLLCFGITPDELKKAYTEKIHRNMSRWKK